MSIRGRPPELNIAPIFFGTVSEVLHALEHENVLY
jgi:hypothetical protein